MNNETVNDTAPRKTTHVVDRVFDFFASWWPPALRKEVAYQKTAVNNLHKYWKEDLAYLQGLCRAAGATEAEVEEDSNAISGVIALSTLLCEKLNKKIVKASVAPAPKKSKRKSVKKVSKSEKSIES